jgi:hypothetical protein
VPRSIPDDGEGNAGNACAKRIEVRLQHRLVADVTRLGTTYVGDDQQSKWGRKGAG